MSSYLFFVCFFVSFFQAGQRLRLGYCSSDFCNHPLSHLMGSVFGKHDRSTIEVFCFALSPSDGSEWRRRIEMEVEHFEDVSNLTVPQVNPPPEALNPPPEALNPPPEALN